VLAGTQGFQNHRKKDRIFTLAAEMDLPTVLFAEGGGGRPGDVDWPGVSMLEVRAFRLFGQISAPTIGVNTGYCFAGNAALLGQCDVIVATADSNLGMGGPAMIEGGGLGTYAPREVGPAAVQASNGVIDFLADDDPAAVEAVRRLLGLLRGTARPGPEPDPERARRVVPENRRRLFDMREVIASLVDEGSYLELRAGYAPAAITGFARVEGRPVGIIANDPGHLAGAIDHHAAVSFERHLRLCEKWGIPVLSLCDTPGFMVGPAAEAEGLVRSAGSLFRTVADLSVPVGTVVVRRGYGLGAMAMAGGGFHEARFVVGWPTSELGPMGLEGAVRLGYKRELEAIEDPDAREAEVERRVAEMLEVGRGINVATHFEIDDVIDPADTRAWILTCLT
jgi:acetyl-CoA carboxylase carboxyltransferase component